MDSVPLKICVRCDSTFPATPEYFAKGKQCKDGLIGWCRPCDREYKRRWEAKRRGYFTALVIPADRKRCSQCYKIFPHTKEHFSTHASMCTVCAREYGRAWYRANLDKCRESQRVYYAENADMVREKARQYGKDNREKLRLRDLRYRRANPEKVRAKVKRAYARYRERHPERIRERSRQARINNPVYYRLWQSGRRAKIREGENVQPADIQAIYDAQKGRCWWCRVTVGDEYHVDHIHPLSQGGEHAKHNLCISCPKCNLEKSAKTPLEFAGRLF